MFEKCDLCITMSAPFSKFHGKIWVGFCLKVACEVDIKLFSQKLKRPSFYAIVFYIFTNNSRSKQNKKNPRHPFVDIGK